MTAFQLGIKISAMDSASGVISKIQQGVGGFQDRMAKFGLATAGIREAVGAIDGFSKGFRELDTATASMRTLGAEGAKLAPILKNTAIQMSKDIPFSAAEFQGAMTDALASGIEPTEAGLSEFANKAARLAAGSGTELGVVVKGLAGTLNAYGASASEAGRYSDIFFDINNAGVTSIRELNAYMPAVNASAAALGLSFADAGRGIALMTQKGIGTADASTQIKALLKEMTKPSKDFEEFMKKANINLASLQTGSFEDRLRIIRAGMDKTGLKAAEIFGSSEAATSIDVMTSDLKKMKEVFDAVDEKGSGSASNAFKEMQGSVELRTKQMETRIEAFKIQALNSMGGFGVGLVTTAGQFGKFSSEITALSGLKSLLPANMFTAVEGQASAVSRAFSFVKTGAASGVAAVQGGFSALRNSMTGLSFSGITTGVSGAISGMGQSLSNGALSLRIFAAEKVKALAASNLFSGGLTGFAKTIGGNFVGGVRSAITSILRMNVALLTSPITWIAAAIAGAAYLIYSNWDKIGAFFEGVFSGVSAAFGAAWSILEEVKAAFQPVIDAVWKLFSPAQAAGNAVAGVANNFGWLKDAGIAAGQYIGTAFRVVVTPILWVAKVIGQTIGLIFGLTQSGGNMARVLVGAFTLITIPIRAAIGIMSGLFTFIQSLFNGATLKEAGAALINGLLEGIKATLGKLYDGAMAVVDGIKNIFSGKSSGTEQVKQQTQQQVAKAEIPAPKVETPKVPDIAAPKVGTPKVPKAETPKLRPLNPPEAPDFSWIEKQNIKPPKFEPMLPPEVKQPVLNKAEKPMSISTKGTTLESPNTTMGVKIPSGVSPLNVGNIKLPELKTPKLPTLPDIGLPPELLKILNSAKISVPDIKVPKIDADLPTPQIGKQSGKAVNNTGDSNISVNVSFNLQSQSTTGAPADLRREFETMVRDNAVMIATTVERAVSGNKRKVFDTI